MFLERGFEGASVDEIADVAHAGKPTIYARFPGKEALFAAVAYLRPALARAALTIETDTLVTRVVLDGRRAIGVEYLKRGARITVHADREVILAAGVINTPQLLMLSGIGDPDDLRPPGIAVTAPLKGVGRNLQDHISAGIVW